MVRKSPSITLPDISDADLLAAFRERERNERKALSLVQRLSTKVEELKIELKAAKDLLEQAQMDLCICVGRPIQTTIVAGNVNQEPEDLDVSEGGE